MILSDSTRGDPNVLIHENYSSTLEFKFFETSQVGIFGIFVLLKLENELEMLTSDIDFNSVHHCQIQTFVQIHLIGKYFKFISI